MTTSAQEIYDGIQKEMCISCPNANHIAKRDEADMIYFDLECGIADITKCPIVKMSLERLSPE